MRKYQNIENNHKYAYRSYQTQVTIDVTFTSPLLENDMPNTNIATHLATQNTKRDYKTNIKEDLKALPKQDSHVASVAAFTGTPTTGVMATARNFTSTSTGTFSSYLWTFGDGSTSTVANPSKTYVSAGTWTVTLTVKGKGGTNTQTRTNYITTT